MAGPARGTIAMTEAVKYCQSGLFGDAIGNLRPKGAEIHGRVPRLQKPRGEGVSRRGPGTRQDLPRGVDDRFGHIPEEYRAVSRTGTFAPRCEPAHVANGGWKRDPHRGFHSRLEIEAKTANPHRGRVHTFETGSNRQPD